jgi:hypothetical protein
MSRPLDGCIVWRRRPRGTNAATHPPLGYDVSTVRDRQNFLRQRVLVLRDEIEGTEQEAAVAALGERLSNGEAMPPTPTDGEWDLLLPAERAKHLPAYFLSRRVELLVLQGEGSKARKNGNLTAWLDGPIPKMLSMANVLIAVGVAVTEHGVTVLRALGLAYAEDGSPILDVDTLD